MTIYASEKEYNAKDRYDVLSQLKKESTNIKAAIAPVILYNALFTIISTVTILIVMNNKIFRRKMQDLNKKKNNSH